MKTEALLDEPYYQYAIGVSKGKIPAGEFVKQACKRFLNDLKREDLVFKPRKVDTVRKFARIFKHSTGAFRGKSFEFTPWQQFLVANIYGFYHLDGTRRFTEVYLQIARKAGKTSLAAILGLFGLVGEGEGEAQVICAANSREQAKILLASAQSYVKTVDTKQNWLPCYRNEIKFPTTNSILKVVSADSSKLDGLNCSTFIIDELHEAKDSKMFDVLRSSQGMRDNPLAICITTAGFNVGGYCYDKRRRCLETLSGAVKDDSLFALIYEPDEGDDWRKEKVWYKAQPNLNETVKLSYMREQIQNAVNNPSDEVGVKTKLLNLWCSSSETWIPEEYILNCTQDINVDDFKGADTLCYVGVDLASVSDLTAVAYVIPFEGKFHIKMKYYLPEAALLTKADKEQYKLWKRQGYLTTTPGNVTDYDYVTNDLMKFNDIVEINSVAYDPYNSTQWAIDAIEKGLPVQGYGQNIANFNRPTRELERLILSNKIVIDNSPITRFCFRNVVLKPDHNGNVKPDKGGAYSGAKSSGKIDGVIAILEALGYYLENPLYDWY